MSGALIVPLHVDALVLEADRPMVEAMADFSRLPYVDRELKREINAEQANISESIVSQPFRSQNLLLPAGVHLHWSMPDALTRGVHHGEHTRFPALPNRWLVTRSRGENRKSWVIESDYVFPLPKKTDSPYEQYALPERERSGAISYFYREIDDASAEPFRYVGRQVPLEHWLEDQKRSSSSYFPAEKPLTALGYGEIAFAAFYPNCHSVFGFHDGEVRSPDLGYRYEVVGWHADERHDPLKSLLLAEVIAKCFTGEADKAGKKEGLLSCFETRDDLELIIDGLLGGDSLRDELHEFLATQSVPSITAALNLFAGTKFLDIEKLEDFDWAVASKLNDIVPKRTLYYSSVSFSPDGEDAQRQEPDAEGEVTISIGNTTMEALSAYLAHQLASDFGIEPTDEDYSNRLERLEDQLESLHLSGKLSNRKLDIGPKFREARHDSGFMPVSGGTRWAVKLESRPSTPAIPAASTGKNGSDAGESQPSSAAHAQAQRRVVLPPAVTAQLSAVNLLQGQYDREQGEIGNRRKQLFSDWYKFMMSAYHPADAIRGDDYPDVDEVKFYIKETGMKPLAQATTAAEQTEENLKAAKKNLEEAIERHNNSLLVHLRPAEGETSGPLGLPADAKPASFQGRFEHNGLRFQDISKADGAGTGPAFAKCLSFDGVTQFAKVLKIETDPPASDLTVSAWIKPSVEGPDSDALVTRTVFAIGDLVLQLEPLVRDATTRLAVGCPGLNRRIGVITAKRWHHLAITCTISDQLKVAVYIDGRQFPLRPSSNLAAGLAGFRELFIGARRADAAAAFLGNMTQVRVDNRALMPAEVRRDMNGGARPDYQLYRKAAPRFWQPKEPVILMVGKGVRATERHGQDGRFREDEALECPVTESPSDDLASLITGSMSGRADKDIAAAAREAVEAVPHSRKVAMSTWKGQPWHPMMLEWEAVLQPARGTADIEGAAFAPDVIAANYDLHDNAVDLEVKSDREQLAAGTVYSNRCFLTSHSGAQLQERVAAYLDSFLNELGEKIYEYKEQKEHEALPADPDLNRYHEALAAWYEGEGSERPKPVRSKGVLKLTQEFLVKLKNWYAEKPLYTNPADTFGKLVRKKKADDLVYVVICAGLELFDQDGKSLTFLSQSLGGFNDELLMHKQTMQLPVEDPLGFDDYRRFNAEVAALLGNSIHSAPEPTNQFNPIRTGALSITRLRLIDTFGQVKDFNREALLAARREIITPQRLRVPDRPNLSNSNLDTAPRAWMPPRLVQPARVDFRWLRSNEDDPDATPICGWVLPNNLQKALAVYDQDGRALGSILQRRGKVEWEPAPGRNREVDEIDNSHLRKMVRHILDKHDGAGASTGKNFLEDFLTAVESALETIDPEGHAQHRSLALLVGRPIAVVRASLDLQLLGTPAVHQGWHAFEADLRRDTRETDNFTAVKFPVRIGEYQQLNDGVVGYWIEEKIDGKSDGYQHKQDGKHEGQGGTFYAPQTPQNAANRSIDHPDIDLHTDDEPVHIYQSIDSPKLTATLLFDPRGKVHLTSGVLPTKVIDIPAEDYAEALEAIEVTFLTAPILTAHGTRSVVVSDEPGFSWSWLEHERWLEKGVFAEAFSKRTTGEEPDELWERLRLSGWIEPSEGNRARIIPMGRRRLEKLVPKAGKEPEGESGDLPTRDAELEDRIERLFWAEYGSASVIERDTFLERLGALSRVSDRCEEAARRAHHPSDDRKMVEAQALAGAKARRLLRSVWDHLMAKHVRWLLAIPREAARARVVPIDERMVKADFGFPSQWSVAAIEEILESEKFEKIKGDESAGDAGSELEEAHGPYLKRENFLNRLQELSNESNQAIRRAVWQYLLADEVNWLAAIPRRPGLARVVPIGNRHPVKCDLPPKLPPEWIEALGGESSLGDEQAVVTATGKWVERILNTEALELSPVETGARFDFEQEIREGWLILKQDREEPHV